MSYMDQRVSSSTQPSSKRDYYERSDGFDEYESTDRVPSKRSRSSPSRSYDPQGMDHRSAVIRSEYPIPEQCVGLVIGRNGSEIHSISQRSGCRVQVTTEPTNTGYRIVEIYGVPDKIGRARDLINEVISRAPHHPPPSPFPPSNALQHPTSDLPKVTIEIPIPADKCGSVIGKGGETMRRLRSSSNCHIQLIQENNLVGVVKPLRITGDRQEVEHAQQMVAKILAEHDEPPSPALMAGNGIATMSLQVKVPRSTVGAIMGVQGATIKKLSDETGTKIQFLPDDDTKLMERSLAIIGNRSKVYVAAQLIKQIVDSSNDCANQAVALFYMSIPASKCGLVIGRGGEVIKQINSESGAHVELSREANKDPLEKTFVIRGSDIQVEHAKHLICIKVGDIPPNTPFVRPGAHPQQMQPPHMQQPHPMQQMQGHPHMQQHHQMQSQHPIQSQNTMTNVQMWTGQPIIQQQPHSPLVTQLHQHQLQQQQLQQQQLQQQQLQQQQLQHHQMHQQQQQMQLQQQRIQQQQQLQQHQQLQQAQPAHVMPQHIQQRMIPQQGQPVYGQPNYPGQPNVAGPTAYQPPNVASWQPGRPQVNPTSPGGVSVTQKMFPQVHQMHIQQQQQQQVRQPQPHQPLQQTQQAIQSQQPQPQSKKQSRAATRTASPEGPSLYAQMARKAEEEDRQKKEEAARRAEAAKKAAAQKQETKTDGEEPDFSEQWLQYYININDHTNAENVRRRIAEMKAEKAQKAAAAARASSSEATQHGFQK